VVPVIIPATFLKARPFFAGLFLLLLQLHHRVASIDNSHACNGNPVKTTPANGGIDDPLRIALISSEAVPFSKTGGLADVAGALARSLSGLGNEVWLFVPHYVLPNQQTDGLPPITETGVEVTVNIHSTLMTARILQSTLPGSNVTVYLIDQPHYFERKGLYVVKGRDFPDNCERFSFFSRAALLAMSQMQLQPDVVHANDWQTGIVPALLKVGEPASYFETRPASVFTLHNLAFQGQFWKWDFPLTGLDWRFYNWRQIESHDQMNLIKTGIVFADRITTVSPTYADEIQTEEFGCGLDPVLHENATRLSGILNGIDDQVWNPEIDPHIPENYTVSSFTTGKPVCRAKLRDLVGLPQTPDIPVIGMVSRMTDQKGFDLIEEIGDQLLTGAAQFVFLGTGDLRFERMLTELGARAPQSVSVTVGFDEQLAHLIEAGSDMFLMPSRYEPC
jgi:starch synthase